MATEFVRRAVVETRMRPYVIVMAPPDFDEDSSFGAAAEPFHAQAFVAELAVEALVVAVLPRLAWIDQRGVDLRLGEPLQDRLAHELGAIVRAQERRRTVRADQSGEHVDHAGGADAARHVDGMALPRELVDDGQTFDLPPVGTGIVNEVVGPYLVRTPCGQWTRS